MPAGAWCADMLHRHAAPTCCTDMLHRHAAPTCCTCGPLAVTGAPAGRARSHLGPQVHEHQVVFCAPADQAVAPGQHGVRQRLHAAALARLRANVPGVAWVPVCLHGVCPYVCMGLHGCPFVCMGLHGCPYVCMGLHGCLYVCMGAHMFAWGCMGAHMFAWGCMGAHLFAWGCMGAHVCTVSAHKLAPACSCPPRATRATTATLVGMWCPKPASG